MDYIGIEPILLEIDSCKEKNTIPKSGSFILLLLGKPIIISNDSPWMGGIQQRQYRIKCEGSWNPHL